MKTKEKIFAFSLAEALITLLIISVITLATVPVITKKKRDPSLGTKGTWICTRNSSGQYVYWDSHRPVGDKNNPDTWTVSNGNKCTFTPQKSVKYSVTVVGGGGGGGDGESKRDIYARTTTSTSFSPTKTDLYDVMLIAGGGGGGGGQNNSNGKRSAHKSNGGGGGGGGGIFEGTIPLYQGTSYTISVGGGGQSRGGTWHGGWSDSTSHNRALTGGTTTLTRSNDNIDKTTYIAVSGGQGGDSIGRSRWSCRGGGRGTGGSVIAANYNNTVTVNGKTKYASSIRKGVGQPGTAGGCGTCVQSRGGKNNYRDTNDNPTTYGNGGDGGVQGSSCYRKSNQQNGIGGYGVIYKTWQIFGEGGHAAIPQSYFVPSMEGILEVTISDAANSGEKGGRTVAQIKKGNIYGRSLVGYGGEGGETNQTLTAPETGEHSQITMKGGGTAAPECTPKKFVSGSTVVQVDVKECKTVICKITKANNSAVLEKNQGVKPEGFEWTNNMMNQIELKQKIDDSEPVALQALHVYGGLASDSDTRKYFYLLKLTNYIANYYNVRTYSYKYQDITNFYHENEDDDDQTKFSGYDNASTFYNNYVCYRDENITFEKDCGEENIKTKNVPSDGQGTWQKAICKENGGNGTSYGAGGGGGNAGNSPGVYSKGGKGGYGAVIVEW